MNTPPNRIPGQQAPDSQVNDTLENAIGALDRARAAELNELIVSRSAKFEGLARDRQRLGQKLGPDHPRVVALDKQLALHKQFVPVLQSEAAAASIPHPSVTAQSWAIHGLVLDAHRAPVAGVSVALYIGDTWERGFGYSCTDARGYFQLSAQDGLKGESFSLHVLRDSKTIYVESSPVIVAAGKLEYREIILGTGAAPCNPPDGQKVAAPPSTPPPTPSR